MQNIDVLITRTEAALVNLRILYKEAIITLAKRASEYAKQDVMPDYRHKDIESDLRFVQQYADKIKQGEIELLCYKNARDAINFSD